MAHDHRENEERTHILQMRRTLTKVKKEQNTKYPMLIGMAVQGFNVRFADGLSMKHEGGLIHLLPLTEIHGKIIKAEAY